MPLPPPLLLALSPALPATTSPVNTGESREAAAAAAEAAAAGCTWSGKGAGVKKREEYLSLDAWLLWRAAAAQLAARAR
jgi:hypothetical protein